MEVQGQRSGGRSALSVKVASDTPDAGEHFSDGRRATEYRLKCVWGVGSVHLDRQNAERVERLTLSRNGVSVSAVRTSGSGVGVLSMCVGRCVGIALNVLETPATQWKDNRRKGNLSGELASGVCGKALSRQ